MRDLDVSQIGMVGIVSLFLVAYVSVAIYNHFTPKLRRNAWLGLTARHGLDFSPENNPVIPETQTHPLFDRGTRRHAFNVMSGTYRGRRIRCFDYAFTEGTANDGISRRVAVITCALVELPAPMRPMVIRPETPADKAAEFFGADDIDFESVEFSRKFHVSCDDRSFGYQAVTPALMERLLAVGPMHIEVQPNSVLLRPEGYRHLRIPGAVMELVDLGCDFVDLLPAHLLRQRAEETGMGGAP